MFSKLRFRTNRKTSRQRGFTLIEVLLSIALIAILTGTTSIVYFSLLGRNSLDIAAWTTAQTIRRAQVLSQANAGNSGWGVHTQTGSVTLFKGSTYNSSDASNEVANIETNITTPTTDFKFDRSTGLPTTTAPASAFSIKLTGTQGDSRTITLNTKGMVSL